jgi:UDP-N-acetylmuramate--alanine ligase
MAQIKPGGLLVVRHSLPLQPHLQPDVKVITYGTDDADYNVQNLRQENGLQVFELVGKNTNPETYKLALAGRHNVENALAALLVCKALGLEAAGLQHSLEAFRGVSRRFEFVVRNQQHLFVDDYAHHPREIEAFIKGLRMVADGKPITVVFQPHLFSRTNDFAPEFASALSQADRVYLLDIYPARELPMPGVDSGLIFKQLTCPFKKWVSNEELLAELAETKPAVLATVGAGDIDRLVQPIKQLLEQSTDRRVMVP